MDKIMCTGCDEPRNKDQFYSSSSPFHKNGKLHVCKNCIVKYVGTEFTSLDLVKQGLRMIDRPFLQDLWDASVQECENSTKNIFKIYMKNLGLRQNRDLTWAESDHNNIIQTTVNATEPISVETFSKEEVEAVEENMQSLLKFWGRGIVVEDLLWLQTEFEDFVNRYECDSKGMELLIKQICLTQLDIEKRRATNEKVDAQLKTLQDLLGSSNLKPVQETGANAVEQETFGTLIKKYENDKPIPEPDEKWKDVDNIGKYIKVFFLGHLSRMLGIKNEYEDEYWDEMNNYTVEEPLPDVGEDIQDGII